MTRDEAIAIWGRDSGKLRDDGDIIDSFAALGMLKLDEPGLVPRSSPEYKLYDAMYEHITGLDFLPFKKVIEAAGLKIVEK